MKTIFIFWHLLAIIFETAIRQNKVRNLAPIEVVMLLEAFAFVRGQGSI